MTCKNCNRELPEFGEFCPFCGAAREEETLLSKQPEEVIAEPEVLAEEPKVVAAEPEKKQPKIWLWVLAGVCCLVVLGAIVFGILSLVGVLPADTDKPQEPAQDPQQNAQQQEQQEQNTPDVSESLSAEEDALIANSRNVVATMGGKELTVGELQMHYQTMFYNFYSQNYYYLSYFGLDLEKPLDEQYIPTGEGEEAMTWQEYFVEAAMDNWRSYVLLELVAEAEGFRMDPELQEAMDNMDENVQQMATAYGYETVEAWLLGEIGAGVTVEDYTRYNQAYYLGSSYLNHFSEVNDPTAEEIEAYYTENEEVFAQNSVTKDLGLNSAVRHILIQPENDTTDPETGAATASEAAWAAAKAEAERIFEEWKNGEATEDSFAALANQYSSDGGSNTNGGLYEDVNADVNFVTNFKNWAIDEARQSGDAEIVETEFGYHIMYFVSGEPYWMQVVGEQLIADRVQKMLLEAEALYPIEINRENILVGELKL